MSQSDPPRAEAQCSVWDCEEFAVASPFCRVHQHHSGQMPSPNKPGPTPSSNQQPSNGAKHTMKRTKRFDVWKPGFGISSIKREQIRVPAPATTSPSTSVASYESQRTQPADQTIPLPAANPSALHPGPAPSTQDSHLKMNPIITNPFIPSTSDGRKTRLHLKNYDYVGRRIPISMILGESESLSRVETLEVQPGDPSEDGLRRSRSSKTPTPASKANCGYPAAFTLQESSEYHMEVDATTSNTDSGLQVPSACSPKPSEERLPSTIRANETVIVEPSTPEKSLLELKKVSSPTPLTLEERRRARRQNFDSSAFDAAIYEQADTIPPQDLVIPKVVPSKTSSSSNGEERMYLHTNPYIHRLHNQSDEWHRQKALEIQARGGRKAWFGKFVEREKWLRKKEMAEERQARRTSGSSTPHAEPKPWSHNRILDFGDVPVEELPEDVLENPAWVKACEWHRENYAKSVIRQQKSKDLNREIWDQLKLVEENVKNTSKKRPREESAS